MNKKVVLGIESSCDETAIGIVSNGQVIYQDLYSSASLHAQYGGVIPELASRCHEENFANILNKLKNEFDLTQITNIAYTSHPGLIGGLNVATVFAKTLGWQLNVPVLAVSHLYGHVFSAGINQEHISYPFLSLVVSGKTTSIYLVKSPLHIEELTHTLDDAAGETLDKIGREMKIAYPAGKTIDESYTEEDVVIPLIAHSDKTKAFSFSGFKTSIYNLIEKNNKTHQYSKNQILSSTFKWILDELLRKLEYYAQQYKIDTLFIGGGVSASQTLQKLLAKQTWIKHLYLTDLKYTGDNGVMIAYFAEQYLIAKEKR